MADFIWRELMTTDVDAAQRFYEAVIGWTVRGVDGAGMRYLTVSVGDQGVGGLMEIPEHAAAGGLKPSWTGYVHVADVDAMAARLLEKGGSVHKSPQDIPGYGRFAVVADPHGALFNIMAPNGEGRSAPAPGTPGTPAWNELFAGDLESDFAFYSDLFGWQKSTPVDMGGMGIYQLFSTRVGGEAIGAMMGRLPQVPAPVWSYYFNTDDVHAAADRVRQAGGQVTMEPHDVPDGSRVLQCTDPQGAAFGLVQQAKG